MKLSRLLQTKTFLAFNFVKYCEYSWKIFFLHFLTSAAAYDSIWLLWDNKKCKHVYLQILLTYLFILLNILINMSTWHMFHFHHEVFIASFAMVLQGWTSTCLLSWIVGFVLTILRIFIEKVSRSVLPTITQMDILVMSHKLYYNFPDEIIDVGSFHREISRQTQQKI